MTIETFSTNLNMENSENLKKLQSLYSKLKKTQFLSRKSYSTDVIEAEQQVNNEHFETLIGCLDGILNSFSIKNDEYVKVISMKSSLMYEQSKILMLLENFQASKQFLQNAISLTQEFVDHPQITFLHMRIANHLAYLLSKDGDFEESKKLLENVGKYSNCGDILVYNTDDIFGDNEIGQDDARSKINKLVANNLQMLAWIYGKLGQSDVYAAMQHLSLSKLLEVTDFDPFKWAYNCIRLTTLYLADCNWSSACYHLVAVEAVIRRFDNNFSTKENLSRAWGDLARAWTNYGLQLFGNSKMLFTERQYPGNFINTIQKQTLIERKDDDLIFLGLNVTTSGIPKQLIRNSEEARCLFTHTHDWLKRAKLYYNFRDHPIHYVNTILDLSELLRFLAFYEPDLDSQYNVQKKRADALETLCTILREVRPQCYAAVSVELLRELSEIQIEMMGINLRRLHLNGCDDTNVTNSLQKRISAITSVRTKLDSVTGETGVEFLRNEYRTSTVTFNNGQIDSKSE